MGIAFTQAAITAGETDPRLSRRADIDSFYTSVSKALNCVPSPFGGFKPRGGLRHWSRARHRLADIALSAGGITFAVAPTTGTAETLLLADVAGVTFPALGAPAVLFTVDIGAIVAVSAFDFMQYQIVSGGGGTDLLAVEHSTDGATWTAWGLRDVGTTLRDRRFAFPPRQPQLVRFIRVRATAAMGSLAVTYIAALVETAERSAVRVLRHQTPQNGSCALVLTDRNCDVWRAGVLLSSVLIPHRHAQLDLVTSAHSFETAILFHRDVSPTRIFRGGGDDEWGGNTLSFSNIPLEPFDGVTPEPIMSSARGWPACGCFWQQRLVLAGLRSVPQAILLSLLGEPFNLNTAGALATDGMRFDLEGDDSGLPSIRRVRAGPRLEVATQMGLFFSNEAVAAKGSSFGFAISERTPIAERSRLCDVGDTSFFVQDGGAVIRQMSFDEQTADKYSTTPISTRSAHLVLGSLDLVRAAPIDETNADLVHILRTGGAWTLCVWHAAEKVSAYMPMQTAGIVAEIGVTDDRTVGLAVDRSGDYHLEIYDPAALLDMSVVKPAATLITGLGHLDGRTDVVAIQGATRWDNLSVASGQLALPAADAAGPSIEIGIAFAWELHQHRLAGDSQRQIPMDRMVSVNVVELKLVRTGPFEATVDDEPWRDIEPVGFALDLDPTAEERLFTGILEMDGFFGGFDGAVKLRGSSIWPFECHYILRNATW